MSSVLSSFHFVRRHPLRGNRAGLSILPFLRRLGCLVTSDMGTAVAVREKSDSPQRTSIWTDAKLFSHTETCPEVEQARSSAREAGQLDIRSSASSYLPLKRSRRARRGRMPGQRDHQRTLRIC
ncbi:unnamed protein product, partial [Ixodes pacificus]